MFRLAVLVVLFYVLTMPGAFASKLLEPEIRVWTICNDPYMAESIANIYIEEGELMAHAAWKRVSHPDAKPAESCRSEYGRMMPLFTTFDRLLDNRHVLVLRLLTMSNTYVYWLTLESVEGVPK